MGTRFKKLLIQEVALAGNPVNQKKFLLIKDGGLDMSEKIKVASLLLLKEDVPEIVKEELKRFLPKEGDTLVVNEGLKVKVKKDLAFDFEGNLDKEEAVKLEKEKVEKLEKDLSDALEKLGKGKKDVMKDVPQVVKDRIEKLEKDAAEAEKKEKTLQLSLIKKDLDAKVGEAISKDLMSIYVEGKDAEVTSLTDKIVGMQKMIKDFGKAVGKKSSNGSKEKLIEDGIEKIKKERGIESSTEAYIIFCKENPTLEEE